MFLWGKKAGGERGEGDGEGGGGTRQIEIGTVGGL